MDTGDRLVGRAAELVVIGGLLDDVDVRGSALLVRGDAGMGKTALLEWAERRAVAQGFRVVRVVGSPAESALAFAGLHQLLGPLLAHRETLPTAQRDAIGLLFGLDEGNPAEQLLISVAALGMIRDAAELGPLLLIVDDLQWLDRASADVVSPSVSGHLRSTTEAGRSGVQQFQQDMEGVEIGRQSNRIGRGGGGLRGSRCSWLRARGGHRGQHEHARQGRCGE